MIRPSLLTLVIESAFQMRHEVQSFNFCEDIHLFHIIDAVVDFVIVADNYGLGFNSQTGVGRCYIKVANEQR